MAATAVFRTPGPSAARGTARRHRTRARPAPAERSALARRGRRGRRAACAGAPCRTRRCTDRRACRQVRQVALVARTHPAAVAELRPAGQRGRLARLGQPGRSARSGSVGTPVESDPGQPRARGPPSGGVPAVPRQAPGRTACTPGTACRRPCAPVPARPRTASRSGPGDPVPAAPPRPRVPAAAVRAVVGGDVHGGRLDLPGDPGEHVLRLAPQHHQPAAERLVQLAQAPVEERQPGRAAGLAQRVVQHEQWQHPVAAGVPGREQRRVVAQPQVPPEPQHAGHGRDPRPTRGLAPVGNPARARGTSDGTW